MSPRPFEMDPAVMAQIRPMLFHDAPRIAELHHAAMGNSLWARLGTNFLTVLYKQLVNDERFLGYVYMEDSKIRGFIAGSLNPDQMMQEVFRKSWFLLGPAAFPRALKPDIFRKLLETSRYAEASSSVALPQAVPAESLFCSFEPDLRGKRISGHINKVLFDDLLARGHRFVKVTTETDNDGANRQLTSWGFESCGEFEFYGKQMRTYVLDLVGSERVDPVSRHPSV
jgi:hypothetical protein